MATSVLPTPVGPEKKKLPMVVIFRTELNWSGKAREGEPGTADGIVGARMREGEARGEDDVWTGGLDSRDHGVGVFGGGDAHVDG